MSQVFQNPNFVVNGTPIGYIPGSLSYMEGTGEQQVLPFTTGGGRVETVYARDLSTNISMIKVSLRATLDNIELIKQFKLNKNNNAATLSESTDDGLLTRAFNNMALTNDYEVTTSPDSTIDLEFKGDPAI